ncbi:MAG: NTP transferase domain-containing protein [Bacteroidaceae bacterium]|nr:NTP transferase domain-containing protein [Bacteroidaceae bacterium]
MRYAIVAGGEGSRLREEGIQVPKPLVRVAGETLLARLVRVFAAVGAESIAVLVRTEANDVAAEAERAAADHHVPLTLVRATTPSSMHSLYALAPYLADGPFCLTTTDTIFSAAAFARYAAAWHNAAREQDSDGLMGVTAYVDDEKPLYVATDKELQITAFNDTAHPDVHYVSAGVYGLVPAALDTLRRCVERGESHLRNFQRALLTDGLRLGAYDLGAVIDIDHATDIAKAQRLIVEADQFTPDTLR